MKARAEVFNMSLQFHIGGLVKDCSKADALAMEYCSLARSHWASKNVVPMYGIICDN